MQRVLHQQASLQVCILTRTRMGEEYEQHIEPFCRQKGLEGTQLMT
jgi:hypothetical protein